MVAALALASVVLLVACGRSGGNASSTHPTPSTAVPVASTTPPTVAGGAETAMAPWPEGSSFRYTSMLSMTLGTGPDATDFEIATSGAFVAPASHEWATSGWIGEDLVIDGGGIVIDDEAWFRVATGSWFETGGEFVSGSKDELTDVPHTLSSFQLDLLPTADLNTIVATADGVPGTTAGQTVTRYELDIGDTAALELDALQWIVAESTGVEDDVAWAATVWVGEDTVGYELSGTGAVLFGFAETPTDIEFTVIVVVSELDSPDISIQPPASDSPRSSATLAAEAREPDGVWTQLGAGVPARAVGVLDLAVSDGVVILGTWDGVLYQTGGGLWEPGAGIPPGEPVWSVITVGDRVVAGTQQQGVYVSDDSGATWQAAAGFPTGPHYQVSDIAGLGTTILAATFSGVWRSDDHGATWASTPEFPTGADSPAAQHASAVAIDDEFVYAVIPIFGVFRAALDDGTWQAVSSGLPQQETTTPYANLFPTSLEAGNGSVFLGTGSLGVFRSADRGESWVRAGSAMRVADIAIASLQVLATTSEGVIWSGDQGETWSEHGSGTVARLDDIAVDADAVYVAGDPGAFTATLPDDLQPAAGATPDTITNAVPTVVALLVEDASPSAGYEYVASVPVVSGIDADIANRVNEQIRLQYQIWIDTVASAEHYEEGCVEHLEVDFDVTLATERLLSLAILRTGYNSCAVSGGGGIGSGMTFDLDDGSLQGLDDLFSFPEILIALSEGSAEGFVELGWASEPPVDNPGLSPDAANFDALALTPEGVQVTFDKYQIGPGTPTIKIPYAKLVDGIPPDSPVSDLVGP